MNKSHNFFYNRLFGPEILLYTDSRGKRIPHDKLYLHYSEKLGINYRVKKYLCPEKWTTTLDFIDLYKNERKKYDYIILHTGIVDFSPRHQKIAFEKIYNEKKEKFLYIFPKKEIENYLLSDFNVEYEGDKTINLYSKDLALKYLLPFLSDIKNLIWISNNKIVDGWNGNYWKERPKNMKLTEGYGELFLGKLENSINLLDWTEKEVMKFTHDNIHPNKFGSEYIFKELINKI